jgi:hypothetical protein
MSVRYFCFVLVAILGLSCAKKKEDETSVDNGTDAVSYLTESALSDAASEASSFDTGLMLAEEIYADSKIEPQAVCSFSSARGTCSSNSQVIDWNGCTIALPNGNATVTGVIAETFSGFGAAVCAMNGSNSVLTRIVSSTNPRQITYPSGAVLTSDMDPGTGWDGTTFPNAANGTVISRLETDTAGLTCNVGSPCYRIQVRGVQNTLVGPAGRTLFDHIVTSDLYAKGTKSTGTLNLNGTAATYHQVALYTAAHTFTNVTWASSSCCFPTSGTVSTTLTGAVSGTTSLSFTSTCGSASFTGTDGSTSTLTLTQCKY